jgi:hypothetical protein
MKIILNMGEGWHVGRCGRCRFQARCLTARKALKKDEELSCPLADCPVTQFFHTLAPGEMLPVKNGLAKAHSLYITEAE